jgi:hypothetical protein
VQDIYTRWLEETFTDECFGSIRGASCKSHLREKKGKRQKREGKKARKNERESVSRAEIGIPCSEIALLSEPNLAGRT